MLRSVPRPWRVAARHLWLLLWVVLGIGLGSPSQAPPGRLAASLLASTDRPAPGQGFRIGLRLVPDQRRSRNHSFSCGARTEQHPFLSLLSSGTGAAIAAAAAQCRVASAAGAAERCERGNLAGTSNWTAILSVVMRPPGSADTLRRNPLGLYVDAIDWSQELDPAPAAAPPVPPAPPPSNLPLGSPLDPALPAPAVQPSPSTRSNS